MVTLLLAMKRKNFLKLAFSFCCKILRKVKTIVKGMREIMTQKVSAKIVVQRGICEWFAYSFYLAMYPNSSDITDYLKFWMDFKREE